MRAGTPFHTGCVYRNLQKTKHNKQYTTDSSKHTVYEWFTNVALHVDITLLLLNVCNASSVRNRTLLMNMNYPVMFVFVFVFVCDICIRVMQERCNLHRIRCNTAYYTKPVGAHRNKYVHVLLFEYC